MIRQLAVIYPHRSPTLRNNNHNTHTPTCNFYFNMADDDNGSSIRQKLSLASVVIVMVVVGLPLWWRTTDVYRSSLPHSEIQKLQKQQVCVQLIPWSNTRAGA